MSSCCHCGKTFDIYNELVVHKRRCNPSIVVTYANQMVTVVRDNQGYCCYCAHTSCPKYFETTKGLINHAKKTGMDWLGPDMASVLFQKISERQINLIISKE